MISRGVKQPVQHLSVLHISQSIRYTHVKTSLWQQSTLSRHDYSHNDGNSMVASLNSFKDGSSRIGCCISPPRKKNSLLLCLHQILETFDDYVEHPACGNAYHWTSSSRSWKCIILQISTLCSLYRPWTRRHSYSSNPRRIAVVIQMCFNIGVVVISVKMHLLTLWPRSLTFQPQNHIISRISQGHSLYQVWTLWDHSFFELCGQIDKHKQMEQKILPTPTDSVCVGNYKSGWQR